MQTDSSRDLQLQNIRNSTSANANVGEPNAVIFNQSQTTVHASLPGYEYSPVGQWRSSVLCWLEQIAPSCLMSLFCSCILAGQVSEKIRWQRCTWVVSIFIAVVFVSLLLFAVIQNVYIYAFCVWLFLFYLALSIRTRTRILFSIPGDPCSDCMISLCCACCSIAQVLYYGQDFSKNANPCHNRRSHVMCTATGVVAKSVAALRTVLLDGN